MNAPLPPSCEQAMTELATDPPLTSRGSWSPNCSSSTRCSCGSTSRIVPFSNASAANSSSVNSSRMSTSALPSPHTSNSLAMARSQKGRVHHRGTEQTSWRTAPRERAERPAQPGTYTAVGTLGPLTRGRSPRSLCVSVVTPLLFSRGPVGARLGGDGRRLITGRGPRQRPALDEGDDLALLHHLAVLVEHP